MAKIPPNLSLIVSFCQTLKYIDVMRSNSILVLIQYFNSTYFLLFQNIRKVNLPKLIFIKTLLLPGTTFLREKFWRGR